MFLIGTKKTLIVCGALCVVPIMTSCKGDAGNNDFNHNVSIIAAAEGPLANPNNLNPNFSVKLTLQNNAGYTTELADPYTLGTTSSGILCWNGLTSTQTCLHHCGDPAIDPSPNASLQSVWISNTEQISIPPFGQQDVILNNCMALYITSGDLNTYSVPCPDLSGIPLFCTLSPFSQDMGWYETTSQVVTF